VVRTGREQGKGSSRSARYGHGLDGGTRPLPRPWRRRARHSPAHRPLPPPYSKSWLAMVPEMAGGGGF
jgi:hypothetical protein